MSYSSRDTSPDPLALPSSPLTSQPGYAARRPSSITKPKPLAPRSSNIAQISSPSKSFIMDTGKAGDISPWRIKVTVEAEPKDGSSPSKKNTRTTKVPLRGGSSSSPVKARAGAKKKINEDTTDAEELEVRRPQRKRKGTPIRRRETRAQTASDEPMSIDGTVENGKTVNVESPVKRPTQRPARKSTPKEPTEKSKRLSQAREELDAALKDAAGSGAREETSDDDDGPISTNDYDPGEMTVANEDFTMVSVETLESMKQNTSLLLDNSGLDIGEKSVASVSYLPSSPPMRRNAKGDVQYPDISQQASAAKERPITMVQDMRDYDAMSWKPTGPNAPVTATSADRQTAEQEVIVIADDNESDDSDDSDAQTGAEDDREDDIWAEEASRSVEEDQHENQVSAPRSPQLEDLFAGQPLKPPRSKIPRTWRRSSGVDFSYVDSPEYGALKSQHARKVSGNGSTDGDGERSSGVLTPPSTDDEVAKQDQQDESDISLTQPDAAGTQLQAQDAPEDQALSPSSESRSSVASHGGDHEDSGMFWQNNLSNLYQRRERPRAQRQRVMDLSELLGLNKSSPAKQNQSQLGRATTETINATKALPNRVTATKMSTSIPQSNESKIVDSPLRQSLLRSSNFGGYPHPNVSRMLVSNPRARNSGRIDPRAPGDESEKDESEQTLSESFDSKASDERQLLMEINAASSKTARSSRLAQHEESDFVEGTHDESVYDKSSAASTSLATESRESSQADDDETTEPARSYEENLNIESPQKIKVKFNDSEGNSSLLMPQKDYPDLFGPSQPPGPKQTAKSPPNATLLKKKDVPAQAEPGIFSRLSTNFWTAVVRPSGPAEIMPISTKEPEYSPSLRAHIRSRYGVLSNQHPWTMSHMRTLHRLLNSCTSGKSDSIVPKSGPLPAPLAKLIGKDLQCVGDFWWTFTEQHAHVVDAFMQVLVPSQYIDDIRNGEAEFLGDEFAKSHRGMLGGRHGDMLLFAHSPELKEPKGFIERSWAVKALGNCVMANIETARKEKAKAQDELRRKEAVKRERKEWEKKNGFQDDDEDCDEDDESEVLPRVRKM